ncbi:hypothetical protein ACSL103130_02210 [Actinomyces slackii]|uniref:Uncharacterized protein n=1 Tax=Actinomyces slackii TaxID=52774 RepID=A0A3S4WGJ2_9ACTO|nr:hypothetical protein [Actinomyces slackii]VEG74403.1 Uncharacterised protein [Actinomyces slackii]
MTSNSLMSAPTMSRRTVMTTAAMALIFPLVACGRRGEAGGSSSASASAAPGPDNPLSGMAGTTPLSDEQYQTMVEGVAAWVSRSWPLMGSVWPGADYTQHRIVAMQVDEELKAARAWVISTDGHRELKGDEYADIKAPTSYDKITFEGKPSISLNLGQAASVSGGNDQEGSAEPSGSTPAISATGASEPVPNLKDPSTYAFALVTHELVHFYYQGEINVSASSSRDTPYPFEARPRILRRMLLHRLRMAATEADRRSEHLGRARYWLDTWKSEFPSEAEDIHHYDIAEGVARYVEYTALSIEDGQSDEQLQARRELLLKDEYLGVSIDTESYALGFITGLLLDSLEPEWKNGFYASGKTLTDLLLENVSPVPEDVDTELSGKVEELIRKSEDEVAPDIKKIDDAEADTSIAYLRCSDYGEIGFGGSYAYRDKVVLTMTILVLNGSGQSLQVLGAPSFTSGDGGALTIPLIGVTHSYADGVLTVESDTINGSIGAERTTEGGREVFVAS